MRADRLVSLILLLQTRGKMTARDLAAELDVSERTILRDIDALSVSGVPVFADGGHGGGIALDEGYRTSLTGLKDAEAKSLALTGGATILRDIGLGDAAESLLLKLAAAMPASHRPSVDHIRQRILIDPTWWWQEPNRMPFWDTLQQAVYEDWKIRVLYENHAQDVAERVLEPYSLVSKSTFWYLIAKRDGEWRTYRAARIRAVELLPERFARDPDFDLPAYWESHLGAFSSQMSGYAFTLRIHPDRLSFVRRLAPGRCDVVGEPDARGWLTVALNVETMDLAKMLVFGLGADGEIITPETLREAVLSTARVLLATD